MDIEGGIGDGIAKEAPRMRLVPLTGSAAEAFRRPIVLDKAAEEDAGARFAAAAESLLGPRWRSVVATDLRTSVDAVAGWTSTAHVPDDAMAWLLRVARIRSEALQAVAGALGLTRETGAPPARRAG